MSVDQDPDRAGSELGRQPTAAVDLPTIGRLAEDLGGDDALGGLVDLYLEEASGELAELTAAARADDPATVLRVAHAWRPASGAVGALELVHLLERAERVARANAPGLVTAIADVAAEYARVEVELAAWGSSGPADPGAMGPAPAESLARSLRDRLEEVAGSDAAAQILIGQLVDSYLQRAPAYLAQLGAAIDAADEPSIATDTHTLAGMTGNIGAGNVPDHCWSLAAAAHSGDWAMARTELAGLASALDDVRGALLLMRSDDGPLSTVR